MNHKMEMFIPSASSTLNFSQPLLAFLTVYLGIYFYVSK